VGQFVIGTTKVIPNVSGVYKRGQPVGVYLQIYNAGIDQTTLRPSVDVEYALIKDGKELGKQELTFVCVPIILNRKSGSITLLNNSPRFLPRSRAVQLFNPEV